MKVEVQAQRMQRMNWETGKFEEVGDVVLEIGRRVYGMLGYGGSESGVFVIAEEPDERGCQLMVEIGGWHRFAYWAVGEDDRPLSKKFGIGYYYDDKEPEFRMPKEEIEKLRHQCEVQKLWNERLERNKEIASEKRREELKEMYKGVLKVVENSYDWKTAKSNLAALLKDKFPGVRFNIRKEYYSWNVSWTDGPTKEMVEPVCGMFVDESYNSHMEYDDYVGDEFTELFGGIGHRPSLERKYSDSILKKAEEKFYATHPEAEGHEDGFLPKKESEFTSRATAFGYAQLRKKECVYEYLSRQNLYVRPEKKATPKKAGSDGLLMIDYSEKAIAIIGSTKEIAEKLKALGGRFNPRLSCGPGWIFSKRKEEEVRVALAL